MIRPAAPPRPEPKGETFVAATATAVPEHVVTREQVKEIAEQKMKDLNCSTIEAAMRMIEGSARSMGIEVGE